MTVSQAGGVGLVEGGDEVGVQGSVGDPGGEDEGQSGVFLPGLSEVVHVRGAAGLSEGPVADDESAGIAADLVEVSFVVCRPYLRGEPPVVAEEDAGEGGGGTRLVVEPDGVHVFDGAVAEDGDGGHGAVASDAYVGDEVWVVQSGDDGDGDEAQVDMAMQERLGDAGGVVGRDRGVSHGGVVPETVEER
jgi:hypothetical protein